MFKFWLTEKNVFKWWEFMDRKTVNSSMLKSIGYDSDTQTPELGFNSAAVWRYVDVASDEFEGLMNAPSHGGYARQILPSRIPKLEYWVVRQGVKGCLIDFQEFVLA